VTVISNRGNVYEKTHRNGCRYAGTSRCGDHILEIALAVGLHWTWGFGILLVPLWIMATEGIIYWSLDY
jgi:hypothetical protein